MTQSNAASDAALKRLPRVLDVPVRWLMRTWVGRVALRTAAGFARIEIFDRSMTVAAQFFTSIFPILIMTAAWVGAGSADSFARSVNMPPQTQELLEDALDAASSTDAFGLLGTLVVVISATSLSRALIRAFDAVWELPRRRSNWRGAWRWLAAVLVLAFSIVVTRAIVDLAAAVPPRDTWGILSAALLYGAMAVFLPWILLAGRTPARLLLPGGLVFAAVMVLAQPVSRIYLPHALATSSERYGSIGVAFTYIAWLYVLAFILLGSAVMGRAIALDEGWLGRRIRSGRPRGRAPNPAAPVTAQRHAVEATPDR